MARWQVIPVNKQKPGKVMGGNWVVLQAYAVANHWAIALLGPAGAKVTAGYGGWEMVHVPRSISITEYNSPSNMEMTIDLLMDGWLAHPIIPTLPASFINPPNLPTGNTFQNRFTGRPVGATVTSSMSRPLAPPPTRPGWLEGSRSSIIDQYGQVRARGMVAPTPRRQAPVRNRESARPQGIFIESMISDLESLAIRQPGDETPHSIRIYGAVPWAGSKRWIIQDLDWGDCIRDPISGKRMRQQVTVSLVEFYQPAALRNLPRGRAA